MIDPSIIILNNQPVVFTAGIENEIVTISVFSSKPVEKITVTTIDGNSLDDGILVVKKFIANWNNFYDIVFHRPSSFNDGEYTVTAEITGTTNTLQANFTVSVSICEL